MARMVTAVGHGVLARWYMESGTWRAWYMVTEQWDMAS